MKKYTVVFADTFQVGSHRSSLTKFEHIETEDLNATVEEKFGWSSVWFVFEGHCEVV